MKHPTLLGSGSRTEVVDQTLNSGHRRPHTASNQSAPPIPALTSRLRRLVEFARHGDADHGLYRTLPLLVLPMLSACGSGSTNPPLPPPLNYSPVAAGDNAIELDEGATYVLTVTDVSATDQDMDDGPDELTWRVTEATVNGHLALTSAPGSAVDSFTQAQVAGGEVVYVHDGGETTDDSFMVQVEDDGRPALKAGAVTVDVAVAPVNDAATTSGDLAIFVDRGTSSTLNAADIAASDPDDGAAALTWRVTSDPGNGHLALSSAPATAITSFTQAQVAAGEVIYVHDGGQITADSFTVQVEDDGTPALTAPAVTVDVTVEPTQPPPPVNISPMVAGDHAIEVGEGATYVLTVSDLSATDPDMDDGPDQLTWRVTATTMNGHLALSSAPATAITSFTQAQVAAGEVIYVHDGGQTTADSFTVQVEDDGTPALAAPAVTVDVTVTAGDQAPGETTLSGPGTVAGDAAAGDDIGTLSATDPDAGDGVPSFSIVSVKGEDGSTVVATHPFAVANGGLEIAAGATASQLASLASNARFTLTVRAADADDVNLFTDTDVVIFVVAEQEGTDAAADTLNGADNRADELRGLAGNDILDGMGGPDILDGGRDDDTLTGGDGADVFVYRFDSSSGGLPNSWNDGDPQSPNADGSDRILDFDPGDGDRLMFLDENTGSNKIDTLAEFKSAFDLGTDPFLATRGATRGGDEFISMEFGAPDQGADPVSGQHVLTIFTTVAISTDLFDMNTGQFNDVDAFIEALGGADALLFG